MSKLKSRKLLLLGLLMRSEMHGYLLNAHLDSHIPIEIKKPTAYNILDKMNADGWVRQKIELTGERERKVYSVTPKGKKQFYKMLIEDLATFIPGEYDGLVSMIFLDELPFDKWYPLIKERLDKLTVYLKYFSSQNKDNAGGDHSNTSASFVLTYFHRSLLLEQELLRKLLNDERKS